MIRFNKNNLVKVSGGIPRKGYAYIGRKERERCKMLYAKLMGCAETFIGKNLKQASTSSQDFQIFLNFISYFGVKDADGRLIGVKNYNETLMANFIDATRKDLI